MPEQAIDAAVARELEEYGPSVRTVEDLSNGTVRVTREWTRWNGVVMKWVAVWMQEPASDDARWASGDIVDEDATEMLYAGDLVNPVSEAYIGNAVVPSEIRMEIEGAEGYALILSVVDPRQWQRVPRRGERDG